MLYKLKKKDVTESMKRLLDEFELAAILQFAQMSWKAYKRCSSTPAKKETERQQKYGKQSFQTTATSNGKERKMLCFEGLPRLNISVTLLYVYNFT